ncbi:alpha/beta hydrolase [Streptomyces sp. NY05-11A]|uniref:alpha/beta hydrolase n=1 Tax=Streptomyces soliscabiei TaxID=588897 RepID=UPI0029B7361E|nr:alpha/beta hydrolase family protein [Streptomyces sp. NY05-11A]MDX2681279.1 alpha/beta hydrolase family protein [Streptomyces sp. NY05-11A]
MPSARTMPAGRTRLVGCSLLACLLLLTPLYGAGTAAAAHGAGTAAAAHGAAHAPRSAAAEARIAAVRRLDARTLDLTVQSPAMGRSVPVRVILPRSWDSDRKRRFPVLYMLHGGADDYTSWTRETDVEALAKNSDVVVVMPDGGQHGYYTDWYAGTPRWETFHTTELVRLMEKSFRVNSSRAVVGLSMGGLGALNYTARHRGMFRYTAALSTYVDLNDPAVRLFIDLSSKRDGTDVKDVWGDPTAQRGNWQAHNPAAMPRAFRGTKVHLSMGSGEPGPLDTGHSIDVILAGAVGEVALSSESVKKFVGSLRSAGVEVTTHFYRPGTHSWPYWQRELHSIWPTMMKELD